MLHPIEEYLAEQKQRGMRVRKRDIARSVGCAPSRISQIINGSEPSLSLAAKLSSETGKPIERFVRQTEAAQ